MANRAGGGIPGRDPVERFTEKYVVNDKTGCFDWKGAINSRGYGCFGHGGKGKSMLAHRWAYLFIGGGEIPEGLVIDHLCRNRACVNHAHMRVVTNKVNILAGESPTAVNARATHCAEGHPLRGENLAMRSDGRRRCLKCQANYRSQFGSGG